VHATVRAPTLDRPSSAHATPMRQWEERATVRRGAVPHRLASTLRLA
jgi:hypothetical protein